MSSPAADSGSIDWKLAAFDAMSLAEMYAVLQLRNAVFVVEQQCAFQDIDGADGLAMHLLGRRDGRLQAYARCFQAGIKFAEASIGRVVVCPQARGGGLGHALIERAVRSVCELWGSQAIRIGAQSQLEKYYSGHGFVDANRRYIEDGIDHLEMIWQP
ncbi:MAG: GNAT family N-acetyltransferase [Rhodoferax sp.]